MIPNGIKNSSVLVHSNHSLYITITVAIFWFYHFLVFKALTLFTGWKIFYKRCDAILLLASVLLAPSSKELSDLIKETQEYLYY